MDNNYFFQLVTASFSGEANTVQLAELKALTENDPELKYTMQVLEALWEQEPETDHVAMGAAWNRLMDRILLYNDKDYPI